MEGGKEIQLDRLKIVILDHGEKVEQVELEDSRQQWINRFNEQWSDVGLEAKVAVG